MPLVKSQQESRRHPRRSVVWKALIKDKRNKNFSSCTVIDISRSGALIKCIDPFKEGLIYPLMINAVIESSRHKIYTMAKICNVVLSEKQFLTGVSFTEISPEDQSILDDFVEAIFSEQ
ncbi:PilZ domain-containing protein [Spartinivicinus ruber]|uniref:PilZ domain-containing protein n=1 Tax=Spartinivicinus ruber TaxID=2683272 RepID=UPI0013D18208|nr:PilZ domain-containing protein [Spartinivicinus ruber]